MAVRALPATLTLPWRLIGLALWGAAAVLLTMYIILTALFPPEDHLLDWHVYAAGGKAFVDGTLYHQPIHWDGDLPTAIFNLPPGAALLALPFLALPDVIGGSLFVALGAAGTGLACYLTPRLLGWSGLWGGPLFLAFAVHPWIGSLPLGNVNPLMLGIVAAAAWAYFDRRDGLAGVLLGVAVAVKLWPLALVPLMVRERRWRVLAVGAAVLVAVAAVTVARLGPGVVPEIATSLQWKAPVIDGNFTIGPNGLDWWPIWLSYGLAAVTVLAPVNGRAGFGLAVLGGMLLIPNLWKHYLATIVFGLLLAVPRLNPPRTRTRP